MAGPPSVYVMFPVVLWGGSSHTCMIYGSPDSFKRVLEQVCVCVFLCLQIHVEYIKGDTVYRDTNIIILLTHRDICVLQCGSRLFSIYSLPGDSL